jgi:hypothetical protein
MDGALHLYALYIFRLERLIFIIVTGSALLGAEIALLGAKDKN